MGFKGNLLSVLAMLFALYMGGYLDRYAELPEMEDGWWGRGPKQPDIDTSINSFTVSIPDSELLDLEHRLANARLGEDLEDNDFHYGFQVKAMKPILRYWQDQYDWRKQEKILNKFPQFKTKIEGIDIHFLRVKPETSGDQPRPLLMVHGWPGSVWEFYKVIPMLTAEGFEVICPSIPGFGFSERPYQKGLDMVATAQIFSKLMDRLGFSKYYVQGGDWGSMIVTTMTQLFPDQILGLHSNVPFMAMTRMRHHIKLLMAEVFPSWFLSPTQRIDGTPLRKILHLTLAEGGYSHLQATKPDTVGFGLNDSPVGTAAYILEKFSYATNWRYVSAQDGNLEEKFTLDELLTNVMIYWFSRNIGSSMRFYKENFNFMMGTPLEAMPIRVPCGFLMFAHEVVDTPISLLREKFRNIIHVSYHAVGGHFAAFEEPELFASDVITFVEKVERITL